jgi:hypothetical protein
MKPNVLVDRSASRFATSRIFLVTSRFNVEVLKQLGQWHKSVDGEVREEAKAQWVNNMAAYPLRFSEFTVF